MTPTQKLQELKSWVVRKYNVSLIDHVYDIPIVSGFYINIPAVVEALESQTGRKSSAKCPVIALLHPKKARPERLLAVLIHELGHCILGHHNKEKDIWKQECEAYKAGYMTLLKERPDLTPSIRAFEKQIMKLSEGCTRNNKKKLQKEMDKMLTLISRTIYEGN